MKISCTKGARPAVERPLDRPARFFTAVLAVFALASAVARAADADSPQHKTLAQTCATRTEGVKDDLECYVTSPLRWDARDWVYFGSAVAAVGVAHHYDDEVRTHFMGSRTTFGPGVASSDLKDAVPAGGVLAATFLYAVATRDHDGRS